MFELSSHSAFCILLSSQPTLPPKHHRQATIIPTADYKLFTPLKLGDNLELKNRIALTRGRANADGVPSENNELYYEQRAGAGLIISEGTAVSEQGYGWYHVAACYTDARAEGWKRVIDRVHNKGGKIFMQMWHIGRQGHSSFNKKGEIVLASALRCESGHTRDTDYVVSDYETPRALETEEIPSIVEDYRKSALVGVVEESGVARYPSLYLLSCSMICPRCPCYRSRLVRSGAADLVVFGRLYITNPDLAKRFQNDWPVEPMAGHGAYYNSALGGKLYND
ncbi:hypothetical protein PHYSODRAFT_257267 [Phytophthora sojae]|uniref:NADH:flavin oxidoreductase/NADH oxidase N-terminal domain-containing protein n=1 Tax=Phytophthora sojae (strain P6497) TaxID=1094619 RepID=G4ZTB4_PHYSP|nr:hypothetical protein PHYSODRAFT_257267 [Phytophthora sojae]EGZ12878.1 hypothetical protein PHYSODRAFT_257267 [Phytophthora sojae]|eukprot:XP_009530307.1 hypothetical protein PHYSODRAFT_257267 [Phytophthora sojae]